MKNKVKDFIKQNKRVSFDEICVFLNIDTITHSDNAKIRQLDTILRDLIVDDFAVFYCGKYCLRKENDPSR